MINNSDNSADFASKIPGFKSSSDSKSSANNELEYLRSIDTLLKEMLKSGVKMSQSDARNSVGNESPFQRAQRAAQTGTSTRTRNPSSFTDGLEQAMLEGLLGSDFKKNIGKALNEFTDAFGADIKDLPGLVGKELGSKAMNALKNTKLGSKGFEKFDTWKTNSINNISNAVKGTKPTGTTTADTVKSTGSTNISSNIKSQAAEQGITTAVTTLAGGGGLTAALGAVATALGPLLIALIAIEVASEALGPAIEGTKALFDSLGKSGNRYAESRKKNLEYEKTRLEADMHTMIETPFKILEESAQAVYDAWDKNVRLINGTQGYSKSDLQSLMGVYADRIRSEGLSKVVSGADITDNLAKVLESGLSGKVAEEFAYQATKLNAAVPTQDFFGYASTYSSLASNAIRLGQSESAAIEYANSQMELFASNVLYASRQLTGGFSTGLKDASDIFTKSVQIAQASKSGDPAQIAGVLTSISAVTGAIAPDLASSLTDAVFKAATGGNSNELVALRSLSGTNASNTDFLRQLTTDPKGLFTTIFASLGNMQNMSPANYMEVAEGLSSIFGISMDAFSRIDFNYLSTEIAKMNVNNASLNENIAHLASGETTTTAEQLKMQQINQYMIDEGLSYVLDNQAARAIQEHMWDEQKSRELMEATYAVELKGSALQFLEGIAATVENLMNFINPFAWIGKAINMAATISQVNDQADDLKQLLEIGKVGKGNSKSFYQLTTTNRDLNVTNSLLSLLGGSSKYEASNGALGSFNDIFHFGTEAITNAVRGPFAYDSSSGRNSVGSAYAWGTIGKSTAAALSGSGISQGRLLSGTANTSKAVEASTKALQANFEKFISEDYIQSEFLSKGKGYDDWLKSAGSFGISDVSKAMDTLGYTEAQLQAYFQSNQSKAGAERERGRQEAEQTFWQVTQDQGAQLIVRADSLIQLITANTNTLLNNINNTLGSFYDKWVYYVLDHKVYDSVFTAKDVEEIKSKERAESGAAIFALAEALTDSSKDLKDPAVQTNALLSQILIVAQAIMQQNNDPAGASLGDTLAALSTNMYK